MVYVFSLSHSTMVIFIFPLKKTLKIKFPRRIFNWIYLFRPLLFLIWLFWFSFIIYVLIIIIKNRSTSLIKAARLRLTSLAHFSLFTRYILKTSTSTEAREDQIKTKRSKEIFLLNVNCSCFLNGVDSFRYKQPIVYAVRWRPVTKKLLKTFWVCLSSVHFIPSGGFMAIKICFLPALGWEFSFNYIREK